MSEMYDAGNADDVREAKLRASVANRERSAFVRSVLETPAGRAWIWDYLRVCHIVSISWVSGSPDATAFREGERNIGLQLLAEVQAHQELYLIMVREAQDGRFT